MFEVIREIVESEVRKINIAEVGEVTSIFPHSSDSDKDNYECNVKLKYKELELRKVPVATQHIGLANTPNVGDLVLITFVNGNINAPVIIGRLYTDEDRPPVHKEEEIVYIPSYSKSSDLRRLHMKLPSGLVLSVTDDDVTVEAGKTKLKISRDGDIAVESGGNISISASGDFSVNANKITIESKADLTCNAGGPGSFQSKDTLIYSDAKLAISGDPIEVTSGTEAKISGTMIGVESSGQLTMKGAQAQIEASGPLSINGALTEVKASGPLTLQGSLIRIG
jgi:phage baseplate assembly protein gpV